VLGRAAVLYTSPFGAQSVRSWQALRLEVIGGVDGAALALPDFHAALALDPSYEVAKRNRDNALAALAEPRPMTPALEEET